MRTGSLFNEKDYYINRGLSYVTRNKAIELQIATTTAGRVRIDGVIRHVETQVYYKFNEMATLPMTI